MTAQTSHVDNLPKRIHQWLNARMLTDDILIKHEVGWNGRQIVIPVVNEQGTHMFNKYRRDPASNSGPKYLFDRGASAMLYNIHALTDSPTVIICEGEFDALCLEAHGFPAVTSTAGAATFKPEWVPLFKNKEVYFCMDNDPAGSDARLKLHQLFPDAKKIPLPPTIKDITDFFVLHGVDSTRRFRQLMSVAFVPDIPIIKPPELPKRKKIDASGGERIIRAREVPIRHFLQVNPQGFARCIFKPEKTGSLKVFPDNKFKCFGCGEHGDVIDIVRRLNDVTLPEAIKIILGS